MGERADAVRRKAKRARRADATPAADAVAAGARSILALQGAAGNRAVGRALGGASVQRKLRVGSADDPHERQADRVADEIAGAAAGRAGPIGTAPEGTVQRECKCEQEDELVQGKDAQSPSTAGASGLESRVQSMRGGGQPLDPSLRRFFEPRFGRDFGDVKVHADAAASEATRAVAARAFTVGKDIAFGEGEWAPDTAAGRHLLAHELAHVVQQDAGVAQRQPLPGMEEELPGLAGRGAETEEAGPADEAEEMKQGTCEGGSRRLDYRALQNSDEIEFTVPANCRRVKVELRAMWDCDGCEWGPETYTVSLDGVTRRLPAGTEGIEEECTGTGAKLGRTTFTTTPGVHKLRIATGRPAESSCRLQLRGFLEIRR